jgi:hypothetical protein
MELKEFITSISLIDFLIFCEAVFVASQSTVLIVLNERRGQVTQLTNE